tara:strand:+ start:454 stop:3333 length:2880 start_codon:yes stop_codon:yes gene_type:complete
MGKARNRAERTGSMDVVIGTTKLVTNSGDIEVKDTSNNRKKIIASEIKLGTGNDIVIIKRNSSTGQAQFQSSSDGGSSTSEQTVGGASTVTNASDLPITGNQAGDLKLVTSTNNLMIHNGTGWYKIATITNASPTISSAGSAAYNFATNGTAVSIEIVATDPEGAALQYKYQVTTGSLGSTAAVTNSATSGGTYSALAANTYSNNRFFKVTPSTNTAHAGTFAITFSVTDGINTANSSASSFTLAFETFGSTALDLNAGPTSAGDAHLEVAAHSDFTLGTNNFTIEGWFFSQGPAPSQDYPSARVGYRNSVGYSPHLFDFRNVSGNNKRAPMVWIGGTGGNNAQAGNLTFRYHVTGSDRITSSRQFPEIENQWFHFAIVRNSSTTTMYINGVSEGTWSDSTNYDEIDKLWIGRKHTNGSHNFTGWVSNFRIVNGTAVYTANFTPPTAPLTAIANTKLLICTKNNAVDDIGPTGHTVTKSGTATHSTFNPYPWATTGWGSVFFDKNNDRIKYIKGGGNAVTGMTALTDLTVEAWVYHFAGHSDDSTDPTTEEIYVHFTDNLSSGVQMSFGRKRTESTTCPIFTSTSGHPYQNQVYTANAAHDVNRGGWYHVAFVKDGTNLRMYKNGTNVAGNNQTSATNLPSSFRVGEIYIGADSGNGYDMLGYMSNLRISNSARYSADFTPSTTPLTSDSNTVLLTCQRAAPQKLTNGATTFSGTNTKLTTAASSDFTLGTGDFTAEGWFNWPSLPGSGKYIVDIGSNGCVLQFQSNTQIGFWNGTDGYVQGSYTFVVDTWYHIAWTRASGTGKCYVNGTQVVSGTLNKDVTTNTLTMNGYGGGGSYGQGGVKWSDFRLVKGKAVYTGAFSPPTGPLTKTGGTYPNSTNRSDPSASQTVLLTHQASSGSTATDNSDSGHTISNGAAFGGSISLGAGNQNIATDQGANSLGLVVEGDVRNARYWPFTYNG